MTVTPRIEEKLKNYRTHVLMAIDFLSKGQLEESGVRLRKSAEAFLKIVIYDHLGDVHGYNYLQGMEDKDGNPLSSSRNAPFFKTMLSLCYDEKHWINSSTDVLLNNLRNDSNCNAHDSNEPIAPAVLKPKIEACIKYSKRLTNTLYALLGQDVPAELNQAYSDGVVDQQTINALKESDIDSFVEHMDSFNRSNRYILIAPFSMGPVSETLMRNLMGVHWSMVIDFDSHSKETGGLFHSMQPEIDENCTPFTILNKDGLSNLSKGINGNVNWVFANGLSSINGTVTSDIRGWIKLRAHQFVRSVLTEFCKKTLSRIYIVSLLQEPEYLEELMRQFDNIEFAERDLVSFSIITDNQKVRDKMEGLARYDFDIRCFSFSLTGFISEIGGFLQPDERHAILVPGRTAEGVFTLLDITGIYSKLSANGISVIHKTISSEADDIETLPAFFRGETISWKELEVGIDAVRSKYIELRRKIVDRLNGRQSHKFTLYHYAGAGGTTISRRLAYDLREQVPTIIINEYTKGVTSNLIELLSVKVNLPMLAIVESSRVGSVDDLIAACNAKKRVVVFVLVERILNKRKDAGQLQHEVVSDKMRDSDEKARFKYKVQVYNPKSKSLPWLGQTSYANCEVIDFSMSIAEDDYQKAALRRYIRQYLDQLSEPTVTFLTYVAFIYHYAQRPVSDLVFRKMFTTSNGRTGLRPYLLQRPEESAYLRKLIINDSEESEEERVWRPRYSRFADIILEEVLGGDNPEKWQIALPEWSRRLILTVKANYEYLTEDVKKMLVAVFLERGKEDLLGREEAWGARGAQEKFSQLLDDMSYSMDDQKAVLKLLAESYPGVTHFWGHLARFCYENAATPDQFAEALSYINKALEAEGLNDYNLLHIAGMCHRRMIEYYHRTKVDIGRDELRQITDVAREYFRKSREVNPHNVYAYTSEIQLLTVVIEYGKAFSAYEKYNAFLLSPANSWFFTLYEDLNELIEELTKILDHTETLGRTQRFYRTKEMLATSESKSWQFVGDYKESLRSIQNHIQNADRLALPHLRVMYVRTLLLSKIGGRSERLLEAWQRLSSKELALVEEYLNKNVQQNSGSISSMRLWVQFVRYSDADISIEEIKSRLKMLFNSSDDYPMTKLEAAFNLYILNLFELIRDNDDMNSRKRDEIDQWVEACLRLSSSDMYPFEWLVSLDGIHGIVSSKNKPESETMERVRGTIIEIKNNMQGTIRLECGYDVFFQPAAGGFIQGKDETVSVSMILAFRHGGPAAYEVLRITEEGQESRGINEEEVAEALEITEVEAAEETAVEDEQNPPSEPVEASQPEAEGPSLKVVGKIELSPLDQYERFKK